MKYTYNKEFDQSRVYNRTTDKNHYSQYLFPYTMYVLNTRFSSSCVPYVASFSGFSIFDCPVGIL